MRQYTVTVGTEAFAIKASSARVAIGRALRRFPEATICTGNIRVTRGKELENLYQVVGDVPCAPEGCMQKKVLSSGLTRERADKVLEEIQVEHPEYKFVRSVRCRNI
jgi:hypothetical protein